jgi:hypothetical protein
MASHEAPQPSLPWPRCPPETSRISRISDFLDETGLTSLTSCTTVGKRVGDPDPWTGDIMSSTPPRPTPCWHDDHELLVRQDLHKKYGIRAVASKQVFEATVAHFKHLSAGYPDPDKAHRDICPDIPTEAWAENARRIAMALGHAPTAPTVFFRPDTPIAEAERVALFGFGVIQPYRKMHQMRAAFGSIKEARCHPDPTVSHAIERLWDQTNAAIVALLVAVKLSQFDDCTVPFLQSVATPGDTVVSTGLARLKAQIMPGGRVDPAALRAVHHLAGPLALRVLGHPSHASKRLFIHMLEPARQELLAGMHAPVSGRTLETTRSTGRGHLRRALHRPGCACDLTF